MSHISSSMPDEASNLTANDNLGVSPLAAFNEASARPFLDAQLSALDDETVSTIKNAFVEKLSSLIDATVSDDLRTAAHDYAYALSLNRGKVSAADLADLLQAGANDLISAKDALLQKFQELDAEIEQYQKRAERMTTDTKKSIFNISKIRFFNFSKKPAAPATDSPDALPWDENGRIYMRLEDNSNSPVRALIEEKLTERGFTITDYTAGRALDSRKNEWKIGKILKDEPALLQAYSDDPSRRNQRLMVVLTRNVKDLARASFNRGWQSCRTAAGSAASRGVAEARAGVIMAYLVSEKDPEIHNPYSRISLKPYDRVVENDKKPEWELGTSKFSTIYAAFNPIGLHHPGFAAAVNDFAENTFNDGKVGRFKLRADCEAYRELKERTRLPEDAETALAQLGATIKKNADGQIKVIGKLDMKGFGLCKLPAFFGNLDLSECDLDLSRNRLLTLEGLPQGTIKSLNVSSNLLVCFAGACDTVTGEFNYRDNHWLMTAYGAPKAATYKYGNSSDDWEANGKSKDCVCPTQKPEAFPGFKRKS